MHFLEAAKTDNGVECGQSYLMYCRITGQVDLGSTPEKQPFGDRLPQSLVQLSLFCSFFAVDSVYTMPYIGNMRFEWDENKNRSNYRKHGVWFEEAQTIWVDTESAEYFDPEHSSNEDRFIRIGHSTRGRILLIVFCERAMGSTIRIISARNATTQEMRDYEKGI
jgi:uncharacterized protein